ncbi:hypothetical protein ACOMHN_043314 [Nucella lapillus]
MASHTQNSGSTHRPMSSSLELDPIKQHTNGFISPDLSRKTRKLSADIPTLHSAISVRKPSPDTSVPHSAISVRKPSPDTSVPHSAISLRKPSPDTSVTHSAISVKKPSPDTSVPHSAISVGKPSPDTSVPHSAISVKKPSPDTPVPHSAISVLHENVRREDSKNSSAQKNCELTGDAENEKRNLEQRVGPGRDVPRKEESDWVGKRQVPPDFSKGNKPGRRDFSPTPARPNILINVSRDKPKHEPVVCKPDYQEHPKTGKKRVRMKDAKDDDQSTKTRTTSTAKMTSSKGENTSQPTSQTRRNPAKKSSLTSGSQVRKCDTLSVTASVSRTSGGGKEIFPKSPSSEVITSPESACPDVIGSGHDVIGSGHDVSKKVVTGGTRAVLIQSNWQSAKREKPNPMK